MGREIRRVPLDFDCPLGTTWPGFLMPDELRPVVCPPCAGRGVTPTAQWANSLVTLLLMLGEHAAYRQGREMHPYLTHLMNRPDLQPTPDAAALAKGLTGRDPGPFGYTESDSWPLTRKIYAAAGLRLADMNCPACDGEGAVPDPERRAAAEAWEPTEPPAGDGWQMWQTVSEGGPVSPVFPTAGALADWMASPEAGSERRNRDAALRFIEAGWAPSGAIVGGTFMSGVDFVGRAGAGS